MAINEDVRTFLEEIELRDVPDNDPELIAFSQLVDDGVMTLQEVCEAIARGADATLDVIPVIRIYQAVYGRIPDAAGLQFWVDVYRQVKDQDNPATDVDEAILFLCDFFVTAPEFETRYGGPNPSAGDYVTLLYLNVLNRPIDAPGLAFWVGVFNQHLADGKTSAEARSLLLERFNSSPEYADAARPFAIEYLKNKAAGTQDFEGILWNEIKYDLVITPDPNQTAEGDVGTHDVTITITLDRPIPGDYPAVVLAFNTQDGTAQAFVVDNDYVAKDGEILFNPGQQQKTITVTIKGDTLLESDEFFNVIFSNNQFLNADVTTTVTILNDDSHVIPFTTALDDLLGSSLSDVFIGDENTLQANDRARGDGNLVHDGPDPNDIDTAVFRIADADATAGRFDFFIPENCAGPLTLWEGGLITGVILEDIEVFVATNRDHGELSGHGPFGDFPPFLGNDIRYGNNNGFHAVFEGGPIDECHDCASIFGFYDGLTINANQFLDIGLVVNYQSQGPVAIIDLQPSFFTNDISNEDGIQAGMVALVDLLANGAYTFHPEGQFGGPLFGAAQDPKGISFEGGPFFCSDVIWDSRVYGWQDDRTDYWWTQDTGPLNADTNSDVFNVSGFMRDLNGSCEIESGYPAGFTSQVDTVIDFDSQATLGSETVTLFANEVRMRALHFTQDAKTTFADPAEIEQIDLWVPAELALPGSEFVGIGGEPVAINIITAANTMSTLNLFVDDVNGNGGAAYNGHGARPGGDTFRFDLALGTIMVGINEGLRGLTLIDGRFDTQGNVTEADIFIALGGCCDEEEGPHGPAQINGPLLPILGPDVSSMTVLTGNGDDVLYITREAWFSGITVDLGTGEDVAGGGEGFHADVPDFDVLSFWNFGNVGPGNNVVNVEQVVFRGKVTGELDLTNLNLDPNAEGAPTFFLLDQGGTGHVTFYNTGADITIAMYGSGGGSTNQMERLTIVPLIEGPADTATLIFGANSHNNHMGILLDDDRSPPDPPFDVVDHELEILNIVMGDADCGIEDPCVRLNLDDMFNLHTITVADGEGVGQAGDLSIGAYGNFQDDTADDADTPNLTLFDGSQSSANIDLLRFGANNDAPGSFFGPSWSMHYWVGGATILTGSGNDRVNDGEGNDTINVGTGCDFVLAWLGGDDIIAKADGDAADTISVLTGGEGDDTVIGGSGIDLIAGDSFKTLFDAFSEECGDAGLIICNLLAEFFATCFPNDCFDSGEGGFENEGFFSTLFGWLVSGGGMDEQECADFASAMLNFFGDAALSGEFADTVGDDLLIGGAGNDILLGDGGTDRLFGGDDHDILIGGPGGFGTVNSNTNDDHRQIIDGGDHADLMIGRGHSPDFDVPGKPKIVEVCIVGPVECSDVYTVQVKDEGGAVLYTAQYTASDGDTPEVVADALMADLTANLPVGYTLDDDGDGCFTIEGPVGENFQAIAQAQDGPDNVTHYEITIFGSSNPFTVGDSVTIVITSNFGNETWTYSVQFTGEDDDDVAAALVAMINDPIIGSTLVTASVTAGGPGVDAVITLTDVDECVNATVSVTCSDVAATHCFITATVSDLDAGETFTLSISNAPQSSSWSTTVTQGGAAGLQEFVDQHAASIRNFLGNDGANIFVDDNGVLWIIDDVNCNDENDLDIATAITAAITGGDGGNVLFSAVSSTTFDTPCSVSLTSQFDEIDIQPQPTVTTLQEAVDTLVSVADVVNGINMNHFVAQTAGGLAALVAENSPAAQTNSIYDHFIDFICDFIPNDGVVQTNIFDVLSFRDSSYGALPAGNVLNYAEFHNVASTYLDALATANAAMDGLVMYVAVSYNQGVADNLDLIHDNNENFMYVFADTDLDGNADMGVRLLGLDNVLTEFHQFNIVVAPPLNV